MSRVFRTLAVSAVAAAALVAHPAAQTASIQADFLKDVQAQKSMLVKIAQAMPENKFSFKATPAERSYGEQILHIAEANVMLTKALGGKTPAPAINMKATSKADTIKAMSDSFDYAIAVVKEQTDQTMVGTIQGPPWMGPSTRARMVEALIGHTQDIYGQMVVYLRLNGLVPPASQRP